MGPIDGRALADPGSDTRSCSAPPNIDGGIWAGEYDDSPAGSPQTAVSCWGMITHGNQSPCSDVRRNMKPIALFLAVTVTLAACQSSESPPAGDAEGSSPIGQDSSSVPTATADPESNSAPTSLNESAPNTETPALDEPPNTDTTSGPGDTSDPDSGGPSANIMAAAILQLITKNHTFGQGPPPFTEYLIQSQLDAAAGVPAGSGQQAIRPLTDTERAAIAAVVAPFGPVRWIDDPADWRTDDLRPTIEGAVILGLGEPVVGDGTGLVPVSLWCGGLCGTWFTYRLDLIEGEWAVTSIEGPIAIS